MRNRFTGPVVVGLSSLRLSGLQLSSLPATGLRRAGLALAGILVFASVMLAQSDTRPAGASMPALGSTQDLSGVWLRAGGGGGGGGNVFDLPLNAAPLQPAARAKFDTEKNAHGPNVVFDFVSNTDPFIKYCDPLGVPRVLLANHPFKIVQAAGEVIVLYERSHDFREIYMDGRTHPQDLDPSWWGHSIGKWDGNALVVDSVGFNDRSWLDYQGLPHSDALHIVERYQRMDHDTLQLELTIDDPKDYTKTWSVTYVYKLKPWDIGEEICTISSEKNFEQGIIKPVSAPPSKPAK